jgi:hypothetical protein
MLKEVSILVPTGTSKTMAEGILEATTIKHHPTLGSEDAPTFPGGKSARTH